VVFYEIFFSTDLYRLCKLGIFIYIFSNSSHLEWRVELSDTILKWDYPRTIPARFGLIWFRGFRGEDFFLISSPFFLFLAWWPSWLEVGITGHNFGKWPKLLYFKPESAQI
jgi:hypothetical protein